MRTPEPQGEITVPGSVDVPGREFSTGQFVPTGSTEMGMTGQSTVYVAMISDRHSDPEAHVFSTLGWAIAYARRHAQEYATRPEDFQESPVDGWLYHATYSVESDSVWVVATTVDEQQSPSE